MEPTYPNVPQAGVFAGDEATAQWQRPNAPNILEDVHYLVKTNGGEWRDPDLRVMKGYEVLQKIKPGYVRGRPILIAKIMDPGPLQDR